MYKEIDEDIRKIVLYSVLFIIVSSYLMFKTDEARCYAKTEGMGLNVDYSSLGGCRIEYRENKWIPLENYKGNQD